MMKIRGISEYENIIRIGDKWLLFGIDMNSTDYQIFLDSLSTGALHKKNQTYHIFISNHSQLNDHLMQFVWRAQKNARKIVIHYPEWYKDYDIIIPTYLFTRFGDKVEKLKYKLQLEHHPVYFSIDGDPDHQIRVLYTEDHFDVSIVLYNVEKDLLGFHLSDGVISNYFRLNAPDMFKERIINEFKEITPNGILKSFKNDDEIWDYIIQNGEWKVKFEEGKKNGNSEKH